MGNLNDTGKLFGALLLGAAIGGTLGILFAPDKGSETRKKLSRNGEDLSDDMKLRLNELISEARMEFESIKNKVNDFIEIGSVKAEKIKGNSSTL